MRLLAFGLAFAGASLVFAGNALADGDAAAGAVYFKGRCTTCHTGEKGGPNKIGPNLFGIYGRRAAMGSGYNYSTALQSSGITWTPDKLKVFLAAPRRAVPNTKMTFAGISKEQDLANVIAYLATLK